jgi:tetratricopeptide (TPR) repeat protein
MKTKAGIAGIIILFVWVVGCATPGAKSPKQLADEYTVKAQQYEAQGNLVAALEQYRLVLTVDPENQLAQGKRKAIEPQLNKLAEEHYQAGLKFYRQGQYRPARKEFLTALRYNPDHKEAKDILTGTKKELEQVKRYIVHTIQGDETISTLAERYYGDYRKFHLIAEYNELEDATKVTVGQQIKIPVIEGIPIIADAAEIQTDTTAPASALPGEVIIAKRFITHTVQPEESLSKLAMMYYGDYSKYDLIAKFNNIKNDASLRVGQEVKIPEVEGLPFLAGKKVQETKTADITKEPAATAAVTEKAKEKEILPQQITAEDQTVNYRELGIELYKNKEYADAITEFNKVLNVNPTDQIALNYMALAYFDKGRSSFENKAYSEAQREFETSLKYNKACPECRQYIDQIQEKSRMSLRDDAIALYNDKKFKEAIVKFEAIAEENPKDSQIQGYLAKSHFEQGLILFAKEDYLAARDEFTASLKYDKKCDQCGKNIQKCENTYKEVHYDKGLANFGDQKLAEAIAEWESVSALDPDYKDVKKNLTKARDLLERLESIRRSKTEENKN